LWVDVRRAGHIRVSQVFMKLSPQTAPDPWGILSILPFLVGAVSTAPRDRGRTG
jgi:hypothetical protein